MATRDEQKFFMAKMIKFIIISPEKKNIKKQKHTTPYCRQVSLQLTVNFLRALLLWRPPEQYTANKPRMGCTSLFVARCDAVLLYRDFLFRL